VSTLGGAYHL